MHEYEPETGDFPAFIAVETGEDSSLPLAIAWALPDGQMKHVLIQPDDEWLDGEMLELGDYSLDDLRSFGHRSRMMRRSSFWNRWNLPLSYSSPRELQHGSPLLISPGAVALRHVCAGASADVVPVSEGEGVWKWFVNCIAL